MPKKIDCLVRITAPNQGKLLLKTSGESFLANVYEDEYSKLLLVHIQSEEYKIHKWSVINKFTGLNVCSGKTRKDCVAEFERFREQYDHIVSTKDKVFEKGHRELEEMKIC